MIFGPFTYIGIGLVGWVMLWLRPAWGFLAIYAVGFLTLVIFMGALGGAIPVLVDSFRGVPREQMVPAIAGLLLGLTGPILVFAAVGATIVALRKWMRARA